MSKRSSTWRTIRNRRLTTARHNQEPCCRCGGEINYTLHGNNRDGPTIDHLHPLALGGNLEADPDLLAPAHRHCNTSHGATLGNRLRKQKANNSKPTWHGQRRMINTPGTQTPDSPENAAMTPPPTFFPVRQGGGKSLPRPPRIGPDRPRPAPTGPDPPASTSTGPHHPNPAHHQTPTRHD